MLAVATKNKVNGNDETEPKRLQAMKSKQLAKRG